jgi:hypothetical protein
LFAFGLLAVPMMAATGAAGPLHLTELEPVANWQGSGALALDRSVGCTPLQIGDRTFERGLGTHARSEIVYELDGTVDRFEAWVGIDASKADSSVASVVFKVVADGREVFDSGLMRGDTPARQVVVNLAGVRELKLLVTDAGDGSKDDFANWADAVLIGAKPAPRRAAAAVARVEVQAPGLRIALSERGEIVGATIGDRQASRSIRSGTSLDQCVDNGAVKLRNLADDGVEFTRQVVRKTTGQTARITERFRPTADSIRWEIEVESADPAWSTGIKTWLDWPETTQPTRYWTVWDDAEQRHDTWRDPLIPQPLATRRLWYGAAPWNGEERIGGVYNLAARFSVPLLTVLEPKSDLGLSLVLSPEDTLREVALDTHRDVRFAFTRGAHRLGEGRVVKFAMDLVPGAGDWRGGFGWMTRRYAAFFDPPVPTVDELSGLGAYSDWPRELDVERLRKMAFKVNWAASYDFPYMGMFLPPTGEHDPYRRIVKNNLITLAGMREAARRWREMGFPLLSYFNVTEFGANPGTPEGVDPSLSPADQWKNGNNFLFKVIPDAVLRVRTGETFGSWEGSIVTDCGGPKYREFLLDQARRHVTELPDSFGICIDRLDWLRVYNYHADDGVSWVHGQPARSLYASWSELMDRMGPIFHDAGKYIFLNMLINRTEMMRHGDAVYHEHGDWPWEVNAAALQCVYKPCLVWTHSVKDLQPDPDAYFQRHLHLGIFPTAPVPGNDHTITPSPEVDRWYFDYGPLFTALRGKKWILVPHAVNVAGEVAKANLFAVPGGYVVPVTFGGAATSAKVSLRLPIAVGTEPMAEVLHPGSDAVVPVKCIRGENGWQLEVPLQRGCAVVKLGLDKKL